jgi:hypothetical protein
MKKLITSCLIVSTIAFSPALQAQDHLLADEAVSPNPDLTAPTPSQDTSSPDQDSTTSPAPPQEISPSQEEAPTPEDVPSNDENEGTPVGQAASEGSNAAKRKHWQNVALAVTAVAVAATALILIANNDGHHSHDD